MGGEKKKKKKKRTTWAFVQTDLNSGGEYIKYH